MSITDDTLVYLVEESEEWQARAAVLYDAVDHARKLLRKADLPEADVSDLVARARSALTRAQGFCDDLVNAAFQRGMELYDAETMAWYDAVGRQFWSLTPEGKVRYVACRKRATARTRDDGHAGESVTQDTDAGTARPARPTLVSPTPPQEYR